MGLGGILASLQNDSLVPFPARDAFAVEKFEQRDGVLARDACPFLEGGNLETAAATRGEQSTQMSDSRVVQDQLGIDAHQLPFPQKDLHQLARAGRFDARFGECLGGRRRGEAGGLERAFDGLARLLFVVAQTHLASP